MTMFDNEGNEIDANGYKVVRGSLSDRNNSDAVVARIKPKPKPAPTAAAGSPPTPPDRGPERPTFKFSKDK